MITITENQVVQQTGEKTTTWTIPEVLAMYDPFTNEPLTHRNAAMQTISAMADVHHAALSETARLHADFWNQCAPYLIKEEQVAYTIQITNKYKFSLTLNEIGLYYKDLSGLYGGLPGRVYEQMIGDFWFYGPLLPLPDWVTRKRLLTNIKNAFKNPNCRAAQIPFPLFEYPKQITGPLLWEDGDYKASNFVALREYGIETGRTTWYDGLVYLNFVSFEHFLSLPPHKYPDINPNIREAVTDYLALSLLNKTHL